MASTRYCYPLDEFIDEHLKLAAVPNAKGVLGAESKLYNRPIHDDHFSPAGAELWARIVGRRLVRLLALREAQSASQAAGALSPNAPP